MAFDQPAGYELGRERDELLTLIGDAARSGRGDDVRDMLEGPQSEADDDAGEARTLCHEDLVLLLAYARLGRNLWIEHTLDGAHD